ncbi:MAG: DNA polymerase I [Methylocystis sp.]|nr:DNA polymerase I [Methylocystis sp.]MCA3584490.1 DNA polymerase I [Methylocystis sp.]MCA3589301.1 DNA polymerase I [Methylocystis sp.]MCA3591411.1 DNA polymerase I [Methylocystis sp.]
MTTRPIGKGDRVFLVDGSNFIFRAYFQSMNQDRKYNYRSDGLPVGAIRLFATKMLQFVKDGVLGVKPTHLAIIFDKSENSFRKDLYPAYKGNRSAPPEDLVPQFPLMRETVKAFGMIPVEQDTYEADDLIATYARQAADAGAEVLIVSADKDLMQLIEPGVAMYDPASGAAGTKGAREERKIGRDEVIAYFGVPPERVADVQALAGDSTDNVPGAPGIGLKTAAQMIQDYGDLDTLLARAGEIKQPKKRETLTDPAVIEKVRISRRLVDLVRDVPLVTPLADLALPPFEAKALVAFLKAMEFSTITRRVAELGSVDVNEIEPDERLRVGSYGPQSLPNAEKAASATTGEGLPPTRPGSAAPPSPQGGGKSASTPAALAEARKSEGATTKIDPAAYQRITSLDVLDQWLAEARDQGYLAVDTETDSLDAMQANLVGFSLALAPGKAAYAPLLHKGEGSGDLFGGGDLLAGQMETKPALDRLKAVLEDESVLKIGQNIKFDMLVFRQHGIELRNIDDTMLMSYALDGGAGGGGHGMDALSTRWLGHTPISFDTVTGTGKNRITFDRVPLDRATAYAAEDADVTLRLWRVLKPRLPAEAMTTVYETLERPLAAVLMRMERRGIAIDRQILSRLSGEFAQRMAGLEDEIQKLVGEPFNLGSPKQLGDILFGKMGLPGGKKTATGQWATGAGALEDLAEQGHELPARILDWRQLSKLKSTYTDALPGYVNPQTNRVHTSFALAATTTGRLSSSEPNIQNIPVRNEQGRKIRTAFVATPGHRLISADYSQIELRVLAHMAHIPQLTKAFADGLDIHAMTASEMFGVPIQGMPSEVRRRAKAINFGIIYGISAFGLANQLGISREEAGAYIRTYFERFPGIRDYMEATKKAVHRDGFVSTIFGRKCHYPQIGTKNPSERAFLERAAINAPIQGSAADIIRRAMVRMDGALAKAKLSTQMLLQVHDELIFEAPEAEVGEAIPVIKAVMIEAPLPAVQLAVPLQVDARAALNWDDAH